MRFSVLVAILMLPAPAAIARTQGARISGTVTTPTDAVIAGAECTIADVETNVSTTTNKVLHCSE